MAPSFFLLPQYNYSIYEEVEISKEGHGSIYIDYEVITNNNETAKFKKWLTNSFASSKITKLSENKINCLKRKKNLKNFLTNKSKFDKIVKSLKRQEH